MACYERAICQLLEHEEDMHRNAQIYAFRAARQRFNWGRAKVEPELRSEVSLTMAFPDLLSENYLISSQMAGLGVRLCAS